MLFPQDLHGRTALRDAESRSLPVTLTPVMVLESSSSPCPDHRHRASPRRGLGVTGISSLELLPIDQAEGDGAAGYASKVDTSLVVLHEGVVPGVGRCEGGRGKSSSAPISRTSFQSVSAQSGPGPAFSGGSSTNGRKPDMLKERARTWGDTELIRNVRGADFDCARSFIGAVEKGSGPGWRGRSRLGEKTLESRTLLDGPGIMTRSAGASISAGVCFATIPWGRQSEWEGGRGKLH